MDSWITPNDKFFCIGHYNIPAIDAKAWRLDVTGLVAKPLTLTLDVSTYFRAARRAP